MKRVAVLVPAREGRPLDDAAVKRFFGKTLSVLVEDQSVAPARVRGAKASGELDEDGRALEMELTVEVPDGAADLLEGDKPVGKLGGMEHLL